MIPVCIGGLKIDNLPKPYSSLQAVEIDTHDGLHYLVSSVAHYLGLPAPEKPIFTECPTCWTEEQKSENKLLVTKYKAFQMCCRLAIAGASDSIQAVTPA